MQYLSAKKKKNPDSIIIMEKEDNKLLEKLLNYIIFKL